MAWAFAAVLSGGEKVSGERRPEEASLAGVAEAVPLLQAAGAARALQWELALPLVRAAAAEGVSGAGAGQEPGESMMGLAPTCSGNDAMSQRVT